MTALLYEMKLLDPLAYALAMATMAAAVLLASFVPAHRAAAVNPLETLRHE